MLKVSEYISYMEHAIGKTPDSRHLLLSSFNAAGRRLFNLRGWQWRRRGPVPLLVTAGDNRVPVPADFGRAECVIAPRQIVELVDADRIMALKQEEYAGSSWFLLMPGFEETGEEPEPSAYIWPVPTTTGTPELEMTYFRKWPEFTAEQTDRIPPIPASFEHVLKLLARAYARNIEDDDADPCEMPSIRSELQDLVREDAAAGARLGHLPSTLQYPVSSLRGRRGGSVVLGGQVESVTF